MSNAKNVAGILLVAAVFSMAVSTEASAKGFGGDVDAVSHEGALKGAEADLHALVAEHLAGQSIEKGLRSRGFVKNAYLQCVRGICGESVRSVLTTGTPDKQKLIVVDHWTVSVIASGSVDVILRAGSAADFLSLTGNLASIDRLIGNSRAAAGK